MKILTNIINLIGSLNKHLSRKGLYEFLEIELDKVQNGYKLLSVGAGGKVGGMIMLAAKTKGFEVQQLDVDAERNPDILADICSWKAVETYDHIIAFEVLEHTHDPKAAAENLFVSLKPEGRLSLTTPFIFPIHEAPYDYFRFTRYGLEKLFSKFNEVQIKERNSWAQTILVLLGRTSHTDNGKLYLISPLFVVLALLLYPLAVLLDYLLPARAMTTGYTLSAHKTVKKG